MMADFRLPIADWVTLTKVLVGVAMLVGFVVLMRLVVLRSVAEMRSVFYRFALETKVHDFAINTRMTVEMVVERFAGEASEDDVMTAIQDVEMEKCRGCLFWTDGADLVEGLCDECRPVVKTQRRRDAEGRA